VHIDWQTLGVIAVVAAAATVAVVLLVAFALVGSSAHSGRPAPGPDGGGASARLTGGTALAALCLLAAGLIVGYGVYLIVA
jgi:hypothetical protein